ncbi:hypothetical protein MWU57_09590 [Isoptericola sp. S6320L]|uniref:hypothetical protein n=1 Tax=Isoptericola sp. S6320L TaxID=2926411 RepID=UPI001FF211A1|nr:hypothetical protein [Isoptericola sp. S6320L]MCK0117285.1 hypothetical protein [Isoptericola sp. S6320L]
MTTPEHDDAAGREPDEHRGHGRSAFDPAESLRLIEESQQRARAATEPDGRLLYLVWGVAWLAGYLVLWTSARSADGAPGGVAFAVFFALLAAAITITVVHSGVRSAGTRGPSARVGMMYGWSWALGFVAYPFVISGIARAGASDEVIGLVANALACAVVGLLYLAGGTFFCDNRLYVLGLWILLTGGVATIAGMPATYLVMALAGGGGFLVMCGVESVLVARRRHRGRASGATTGVGPGVGDD